MGQPQKIIYDQMKKIESQKFIIKGMEETIKELEANKRADSRVAELEQEMLNVLEYYDEMMELDGEYNFPPLDSAIETCRNILLNKYKCVNCDHEVWIMQSKGMELSIAECEKCGVKGLRIA